MSVNMLLFRLRAQDVMRRMERTVDLCFMLSLSF